MKPWQTVHTIVPRAAILGRLGIALVLPLAGLVLLLAALPRAAFPQVVAVTVSSVGGAFPIVTDTGSQIWPVLAYNSTGDEYLVIYKESDDIVALRLQGDGTAIGDPLIVTDTVQASQTAVVYHEQAGEYLVVWNQWPGENDWSVYGRRLSAMGGLLGEGIDVAVRPGRQRAPAVAAHKNGYLVVWDEDLPGGGWDFHIYGLAVSEEGHIIGEAVRMSADPGVQQISPDIVYNAQRQESLLVFRDARYYYRGSGTNDDIFGQRIRSAGDPVLEHDIPISTQYSEKPGGNAQNLPAVAYDSLRDRYLVVWEDRRNDLDVVTEPHPIDIYGQILSGEGITVGTPALVNFPIRVAEELQRLPDVTYSDRAGEYLVVWEDYRGTDADIYARRVSGDGALLGDEIVVTDAPGNQQAPVVVYGAGTGEYLIVWQDDRNRQTSGTDLYGRLYRPPDLDMTKTADPSTALPYQGQVTYTIVLRNSGDSDALDTLIMDTLPITTSFDHWIEQPAGVSVRLGPPDEITWTGTVSAGESITLLFAARHSGAWGTSVINTATYNYAGRIGSTQVGFTVTMCRLYLPMVVIVWSDENPPLPWPSPFPWPSPWLPESSLDSR